MYARSPFLTFVHEESLILSVYEESLILSVYEESLLTLVRGVPLLVYSWCPALGVLFGVFGSRVGTLFGALAQK